MDRFGSALAVKGNHAEAALAFEVAGNYEYALEAYQKACCWRETFVLCQKLKTPEVEVKYIARELARTI